jgi:hypothetical protein
VESPAGRFWRFALVRMNSDAMRVRRGDSLVLEWEGLREVWRDNTRTYCTFNFNPDEVLSELAQTKEQNPLQPKEAP